MNYNKKSVEDIDVAGKKVLVRCDFNVPLKDGAPDLPAILEAVKDPTVSSVFIQRSRGYSARKSLTIGQIEHPMELLNYI